MQVFTDAVNKHVPAVAHLTVEKAQVLDKKLKDVNDQILTNNFLRVTAIAAVAISAIAVAFFQAPLSYLLFSGLIFIYNSTLNKSVSSNVDSIKQLSGKLVVGGENHSTGILRAFVYENIRSN